MTYGSEGVRDPEPEYLNPGQAQERADAFCTQYGVSTYNKYDIGRGNRSS